MSQRRQATATRGSPVLRRQSAVTMAGPLIQFRPSPSLNESVNGPEVCNLAFKIEVVCTENSIRVDDGITKAGGMIGLLCFALAVLASPFMSKVRLEAENAVLRHQLIVLSRRVHGRVRFTNHDRWFFIQLYRWFPSILKVFTIIQPETLVRWHRAGFRCYWRWKSRPRGGRPQIDTEMRVLIRRMSVENPLWGAPRIHGELLKLGL